MCMRRVHVHVDCVWTLQDDRSVATPCHTDWAEPRRAQPNTRYPNQSVLSATTHGAGVQQYDLIIQPDLLRRFGLLEHKPGHYCHKEASRGAIYSLARLHVGTKADVRRFGTQARRASRRTASIFTCKHHEDFARRRDDSRDTAMRAVPSHILAALGFMRLAISRSGSWGREAYLALLLGSDERSGSPFRRVLHQHRVTEQGHSVSKGRGMGCGMGDHMRAQQGIRGGRQQQRAFVGHNNANMDSGGQGEPLCACHCAGCSRLRPMDGPCSSWSRCYDVCPPCTQAALPRLRRQPPLSPSTGQSRRRGAHLKLSE